MYILINQNIDIILGLFERNLDIKTYLSIVEGLRSTNVKTDLSFQQKYRLYWRMNAARLSESFYGHYFALLEESKKLTDLDLEVLSRKLYKVPTHSKGRQSLQFSFATKLVHTVNPAKPVYDAMVADFYFFPSVKNHWSFEQKLNSLLDSYRFLVREHNRILGQNLLSESIRRFREYFQVGEFYTDQKIIDSLIWKFVILLRSGALRTSAIFYT